MDISKNYICREHADAAIILLLGNGGSNALTKAAAKWLVKQGVNVLSLGPVNGAVGYHSFPLEHVEDAIQALKRCGNQKIGILGASITTIPALMLCADKTVIHQNYEIGICQTGLDNRQAALSFGWVLPACLRLKDEIRTNLQNVLAESGFFCYHQIG